MSKEKEFKGTVLTIEDFEDAVRDMIVFGNSKWEDPTIFMSHAQMEKLYATLIPNTLEGWLTQKTISKKVQADNPLAKEAAQIKKSKLWKVLG